MHVSQNWQTIAVLFPNIVDAICVTGMKSDRSACYANFQRSSNCTCRRNTRCNCARNSKQWSERESLLFLPQGTPHLMPAQKPRDCSICAVALCELSIRNVPGCTGMSVNPACASLLHQVTPQCWCCAMNSLLLPCACMLPAETRWQEIGPGCMLLGGLHLSGVTEGAEGDSVAAAAQPGSAPLLPRFGTTA